MRREVRRLFTAALALITISVVGKLSAHEEGSGVAYPLDPSTLGTMADQTFTFRWADSGDLPQTTTAAIDWFYTADMPPPSPPGSVPPDLIGMPIVRDVSENEDTNIAEWRTASVAAGNYWIYSVLKDTHENQPYQTIAFSRAPVTIAHPGDEVGPAVLFVPPQNPFAVGDAFFDVGYESMDPDGTATVQLAAMTQRDGSDIFLLDSNLPAGAEANYRWDTSQVPEGLYILRAVIRDARGRGFTAFSRFMVRVDHTLQTFDAGPGDGSTSPLPDETGCSCRTSPKG